MIALLVTIDIQPEFKETIHRGAASGREGRQ